MRSPCGLHAKTADIVTAISTDDGKGCSVNRLLFLCTGNYYRSRFAEILFNAQAAMDGLPWQAFSRGLAIEMGVQNVGPMSAYAVKVLADLGITSAATQRLPMPVQEHDLQQAHVIIALQEAEHRPYVQERHPAWVDKMVYWHIRDVLPTPAYDPLHEIAQGMQSLLQQLRQPVASQGMHDLSTRPGENMCGEDPKR